jgi:Zn-dependent peptidase ImmA (M78 family)/transcriptional regulator with XRE-family HTH domain
MNTHLRDLRKRASLSQTELARLLGIDTSLISRWEKGERQPSAQQLLDFARSVGVTFDFLLNSEVQPQFKLRPGSTSDVAEEGQVKQTLLDAEQELHYVQSAYKLADKPLRSYGLKFDLAAFSEADMPDFVQELRGLLKLNRFVTLDELKGALADSNIHVFEWAMPRVVSGLSYRSVFTAIFVNSNHSKERRLFTLAHELGHILFHLERNQLETFVSLFSSNRDPAEKQANAFAAELLMPTQLVNELLPMTAQRLTAPAGLESFARLFNVSRDAMFYRLASKGFYNWTDKKRFFTEVPAESIPVAPHVTDIDAQLSPQFVQVALELYDKERVSAGKLTDWLFASRPTVETYLSGRYSEVESLIA